MIQRFSPEDPALGGRPTDDPALDGVRPTDDPSLGLGPLREMLEFGGCIFIIFLNYTFSSGFCRVGLDAVIRGSLIALWFTFLNV
ncbi:unnamed protein product [Gadus morhua 'NCC']